MHHVAGRQHDDALLVPLCLNCHRDCSVAQVDDGVPLRRQPTLPERVVAALEAIASFFRGCADACIRWAQWLFAFIAGLDQDFPTWRDKPWAQ
jgi:hypothetical protein